MTYIDTRNKPKRSGVRYVVCPRCHEQKRNNAFRRDHPEGICMVCEGPIKHGRPAHAEWLHPPRRCAWCHAWFPQRHVADRFCRPLCEQRFRAADGVDGGRPACPCGQPVSLRAFTSDPMTGRSVVDCPSCGVRPLPIQRPAQVVTSRETLDAELQREVASECQPVRGVRSTHTKGKYIYIPRRGDAA